MTPALRFAFGLTTLLLLVVLPLGIYLARTRAKVNAAFYWVVLYPAWYLSNAVLHEGSHYLVNRLSGVQVTGVRLVPRFWKGDWSEAFVNTGPWSPVQAALGATAPYWLGLVSLLGGLLLLRRIRGRSPLLASLVLTVLCLRPLADLVNNYAAALGFGFGDFAVAARAMGPAPMHALALGLLACTLAGCVWAVRGTPPPRPPGAPSTGQGA
jgi:hypothetical protein